MVGRSVRPAPPQRNRALGSIGGAVFAAAVAPGGDEPRGTTHRDRLGPYRRRPRPDRAAAVAARRYPLADSPGDPDAAPPARRIPRLGGDPRWSITNPTPATPGLPRRP